MEKLDFFINDRMRILMLLNQNLVNIDGVQMCPMNQNEIANEIGCSKVKANQLIRELIDEGYILTFKKGRYSLSDEAIDIIGNLEGIFEIITNEGDGLMTKKRFSEDSRVKIPALLHFKRLGYEYQTKKVAPNEIDKRNNVFKSVFKASIEKNQ